MRGDPAYCYQSVALNIGGARVDGTTAIRSAGEACGCNFFGQSSFASHALAYERNVVKVDPAAPLELLGPLGCGVQTGVGAILRSLDCRPGSGLLILGGGSVGLSAVMGARLRGLSPVIVFEPVAVRRALALSLGATHVLDPAETPDIAAAVRAIVPVGIDYVFDTTGIPGLQNAGMDCLAPRGAMGVVGVTPPGVSPPGEMRAVMRAGLTIRGIIEGDSEPDSFIPEMVEWFLQGRLPFDRMIRTYPLSEINHAVRDHREGRCLKAVLLPGA
jgi:aryl-alcohol dehydrogenase